MSSFEFRFLLGAGRHILLSLIAGKRRFQSFQCRLMFTNYSVLRNKSSSRTENNIHPHVRHCRVVRGSDRQSPWHSFWKPNLKADNLLTWLVSLDIWRDSVLQYIHLTNSRRNILLFLFVYVFHVQVDLQKSYFIISLCQSNYILGEHFCQIYFSYAETG